MEISIYVRQRKAKGMLTFRNNKRTYEVKQYGRTNTGKNSNNKKSLTCSNYLDNIIINRSFMKEIIHILDEGFQVINPRNYLVPNRIV